MPDPDPIELPEAWTWRKSLAGVEQIPGGATWGVACNCHDDCYCVPRWWPEASGDDRSWPEGRVFATEAEATHALAVFVARKAAMLRIRATYLDSVAARLGGEPQGPGPIERRVFEPKDRTTPDVALATIWEPAHVEPPGRRVVKPRLTPPAP
jgi:hypothetical protein